MKPEMIYHRILSISGDVERLATNTKGQLSNLWEIVPNRGKQARKPSKMGVALKRCSPFSVPPLFFFLPSLLFNDCKKSEGALRVYNENWDRKCRALVITGYVGK